MSTLASAGAVVLPTAGPASGTASPSPYTYYPTKWWDDSDPSHVRRMHQGQSLPVEVLRHIFLMTDPHTLYTSVRALNSRWKHIVESDLIPTQFRTGRWRIGLRVSRYTFTTPNSGAYTAAAPTDGGSQDSRQTQELDRQALEAHHASLTQRMLDTPDTREDELARVTDAHQRAVEGHGALSSRVKAGEPPLVHVVPLKFARYDPTTFTLHFSTGGEWHALFSSMQQEGSQSSWLGLDFGLCWRYWGDGKPDPSPSVREDIDKLNRLWGLPDPENGWLSRFWFSEYDVRDATAYPASHQEGEEITLRSTPLAPRTRRPGNETPGLASPPNEPAWMDPPRDDKLVWSDTGHRYAAIDLSLGIEYFTRQAARVKLQSQKLEGVSNPRSKRGKRSGRSTPARSGASTPRGFGCTQSTDAARQTSTGQAVEVDDLRRAVERAFLSPNSPLRPLSPVPNQTLKPKAADIWAHKPTSVTSGASSPMRTNNNRSGTSTPLRSSGASSSGANGIRSGGSTPASPQPRPYPSPYVSCADAASPRAGMSYSAAAAAARKANQAWLMPPSSGIRNIAPFQPSGSGGVGMRKAALANSSNPPMPSCSGSLLPSIAACGALGQGEQSPVAVHDSGNASGSASGAAYAPASQATVTVTAPAPASGATGATSPALRSGRSGTGTPKKTRRPAVPAGPRATFTARLYRADQLLPLGTEESEKPGGVDWTTLDSSELLAAKRGPAVPSHWHGGDVFGRGEARGVPRTDDAQSPPLVWSWSR